VINVADGADIDVWFAAIKFLFRHGGYRSSSKVPARGWKFEMIIVPCLELSRQSLR
jgi:hypothetical protein